MQEIINREVDLVLQYGCIEQIAPAAPTRSASTEKSGMWRFCVDSCMLNRRSILDVYTLQRMENILEKLH